MQKSELLHPHPRNLAVGLVSNLQGRRNLHGPGWPRPCLRVALGTKTPGDPHHKPRAPIKSLRGWTTSPHRGLPMPLGPPF